MRDLFPMGTSPSASGLRGIMSYDGAQLRLIGDYVACRARRARAKLGVTAGCGDGAGEAPRRRAARRARGGNRRGQAGRARRAGELRLSPAGGRKPPLI